MHTDSDYRQWEQIEEDRLLEAAHALGDIGPEGEDELKGVQRLLAAGEVIRVAGLTPIYAHDPKTDHIAVYAEELYRKKLH